MAALRLVFAEDNYLVREGTAALLSRSPELEVVALAQDLDDLLGAVERHRPDVVLTDIRMPPTWTDEGIEAARRIRREDPGVGVVVLSQYAEDAYAVDLLKEGAAGLGYLLKERVSQLEQVVAALRAVAAGDSVIDAKVVEALVARRPADSGPLAELAPRELDVLREMATGKSNQAIARTLFLSERAVEKNINAVFTKLGLGQEPDINRRVRAVLTFLDSTDHG
jgi:DNA-binding NarL/FixJ family response regulator